MQTWKLALLTAIAGISVSTSVSGQGNDLETRQQKELEAARSGPSSSAAPFSPGDTEAQKKELETLRALIHGGAASYSAADPAVQERELEAVRKVIAEMQGGEPEPASPAAPAPETPQLAPAESAPAEPQTRQEKLQALTEAYKADLITAAEYHEKRARLISER